MGLALAFLLLCPVTPPTQPTHLLQRRQLEQRVDRQLPQPVAVQVQLLQSPPAGEAARQRLERVVGQRQLLQRLFVSCFDGCGAQKGGQVP